MIFLLVKKFLRMLISNQNMKETYIEIENINVWARVGVLAEERLIGQLFALDILLWSDLDKCSKSDDLNLTIDYSTVINEIKLHSKEFTCFTIERYSEELYKILKSKFNFYRLKIKITKSNPPINGFDGKVSIVKLFENI